MAIDFPRRKSVMARSIKLGHCVCNPRQPCPCDDFKKYNVCACAGERLPPKTGNVRLTEYVRSAGCASKIGQADLLRILNHLPSVTDPNVLLGTAAGDDAGVYRISDQYYLVQTVDVFAPCVDDPYLFGQIAAANSVSDVYAMGGRPLTALSIIGFPIDELDGSIMEAMLRGGMDKLQEAHCSLIGGHSINDEEIKLGFAVTGLMDARQPVQRSNARPGDALVLTKPLGTGMVSFAAQIGRISQKALNEVGASMATLNKDAAELMMRYDAHACTDITGFGLAGHLVEMVRGSGVAAEIDMSALPVFAAAAECLRNDILSGAIERNQEYAMAWVRIDDPSGEENLPILYDPQTSGGLVVSLPEEQAKTFVDEMHKRGHKATSRIGRIIAKEKNQSEGKVVIINSRLRNLVGDREASIMAEKKDDAVRSTSEPAPVAKAAELSCCSAAANESCFATPAAAQEAKPVATPALFMEYMKEVNKEGLIDARVKKLMAVALSIAQRCKPCLIIHMKGALAMGITKAEIEEVASLAVSFAGCPSLMLYQDVCAELNL
jgi:selenide,water dikinase